MPDTMALHREVQGHFRSLHKPETVRRRGALLGARAL